MSVDITDLIDCQQAIQSGELSPELLLDTCLKVIDAHEATLQAWAIVDRERARDTARVLALEASSGKFRGPLHGIPVGIKDIFDVAGLPTAAGAKRWSNQPAVQDSVVVERLRAAGAIVLGKTITTPYALFDPAPTRHPTHDDRTPGGSSAGSAAAVAEGMVPVAIGSQTGGSTIRPAAFCGTCGFKPTYGIVSLQGAVPLAESLDHLGIIANTITGIHTVFEVLREQPLPRPIPRAVYRLRGKFEDSVAPEILDAVKHWCSDYDIGEVSAPPEWERAIEIHRSIMAYECHRFHHERQQRDPGDYPPKITAVMEFGATISESAYRQALADREQLQQTMQAAIGPHVLVVPATSTTAPTRETTGSPEMQSPWSLLGWPAVTFPIDDDADGLPIGVQLVSLPNRDADILNLAESFTTME